MRTNLRTLAAGAALFAALSGAATAEEYDCVIEPAATVRVASPVAGLLAEVLVERGDRVVKGQPLARLRDGIERADVALRREEATSDAEIGAQSARLALAEQRLARTETLVARKVVAAEQLDEARAEREVAARDLAAAEMRARLARLELERAEIRLAARRILSPVDGVVTARPLNAGEFLHQEAHVATIAQLDPLHVEAFLPVEVYGAVREGDTAMVRPDPPVTGEYQGVVAIVDQVFDAASGTFGARVLLPNPDHALPAGHRCRLVFPGS